jgi:hypothetical protein
MNSYLIFDNKSVIKSEHLNEEIYNFLDKTFIIPVSFIYDVVKITEKYVARPDLLSLDIYGDDSYVDIICKLNGIGNPFELNEGDTIILPNMGDIDNFIIMPNAESLEKETLKEISPKSKAKKEKRKPNDAIIGDKRFTIDTKKRVIIY